MQDISLEFMKRTDLLVITPFLSLAADGDTWMTGLVPGADPGPFLYNRWDLAEFSSGSIYPSGVCVFTLEAVFYGGTKTYVEGLDLCEFVNRSGSGRVYHIEEE